jgi:mRNA-degrading endonuclease toxin of MazEF toxin-antitoxin module
VATLSRGSIVWVTCPDAQRQNPKCRPAVILTATEDLKVGQAVHAVAVSTTFSTVPVAERVDLPWASGGHVKTGLKQSCAAICTWIITFTLTAEMKAEGFVPGKHLLEIIRKVGEIPA